MYIYTRLVRTSCTLVVRLSSCPCFSSSIVKVLQVLWILHLEPFLDASSLWSDFISSIKILSLLSAG